MSHHSSSPFPSCLRPTADDDQHSPPQPPPPPPNSGKPNLTTCLYHTDFGLFSLTWSRSFLGRSLHLTLLNHHHPHHPFESPPSTSSSSSSFHLHIKPFIFWRKHGSKKLTSNIQIFWDLTKAKFGSGPEPQSRFYIAVVVDKQMTLLVGDSTKEAYAKTNAPKPKHTQQALVLKREHVVANKIYTTRTRFGGRTREIQIDCGSNHSDETRLCFSVDNKQVLQVKRLKWKFRGNERIEIDGVPVQISWDVYNWLFDKDNDDAHAVFMFKFEEDEEEKEDKEAAGHASEKNGMSLWSQQSLSYGMNRIEWRKMRKSLSSSSVSMSSSGGSSGGSSVMEWASTEESELGTPSGFSLLVYAWKK